MFRSILKNYKKMDQSIKESRDQQQERLKKFDEQHQKTLASMNNRRKEFERLKQRISHWK